MVRKEVAIRGGSGYRADRRYCLRRYRTRARCTGSATSPGGARCTGSASGGARCTGSARDAGYYGTGSARDASYYGTGSARVRRRNDDG